MVVTEVPLVLKLSGMYLNLGTMINSGKSS